MSAPTLLSGGHASFSSEWAANQRFVIDDETHERAASSRERTQRAAMIERSMSSADAPNSGRAKATVGDDARPPSNGSASGSGARQERRQRHHTEEHEVDASDDFLTAVHGGSDFTPPRPSMSGEQSSSAHLRIDEEMADALKEEESSGGDVLAHDNDSSQQDLQQVNATALTGAPTQSKRKRDDVKVEEETEPSEGSGALTTKRKDGYLDSEAYDPIKFGDFATYMRHKRQKLKVQENALVDEDRMLRAYQASQKAGSPSGVQAEGEPDEGPSLTGTNRLTEADEFH